MFKMTNKYADKTYHPKTTDLANKRKENKNTKVQSKRELLAHHQKNGTLTKAIIQQIYKMK